MMRKYFPLEASERLFVAIEEDDVVDAQVSLPPTIALSCTPEIIHDNYALCLQFWLNGVDRQELLRLVRKQAKGDELTADERKQFKYMRARYKHLRFAQRLYLKKHQAGFLFGKTTVFLGRFQLAFRRDLCELGVHLSILGVQLQAHRLSADLSDDAGGVAHHQRDEHQDQKAGAAAHRNRKGSRARQSPARDVARYPHADEWYHRYAGYFG